MYEPMVIVGQEDEKGKTSSIPSHSNLNPGHNPVRELLIRDRLMSPHRLRITFPFRWFRFSLRT